jgi:hypothetical protein
MPVLDETLIAVDEATDVEDAVVLAVVLATVVLLVDDDEEVEAVLPPSPSSSSSSSSGAGPASQANAMTTNPSGSKKPSLFIEAPIV